MVNRFCKCCYHLAGRPDAAANFYNDHFIPDHWALCYTTLNECSGVSLMGYCKDCNGELEETISLPKGLTGDDLLKAIYDTVQTSHPYDEFSQRAGYYGGCEERNWFYASRDQRAPFWRNAQFLSLFNNWDQEQVRLWLEKSFPLEKHAEVFRDTGESLFSSVIRRAKANGNFDDAGAILDYYLPSEHEPGTGDKGLLTSYEFDFVPIVNYGCEGIYIDCYLKGKFDESGRSTLHVGTLKTLSRDLESAKIMGELCGALMHHANQYVNQELHRYTSERELEAQHWQKVKENRGVKGGGHE